MCILFEIYFITKSSFLINSRLEKFLKKCLKDSFLCLDSKKAIQKKPQNILLQS